MTGRTEAKTARVPLVVFVLTLGTFLMSTNEFVVAGLLPEMADDFGIGVARAGLLVTAFAIGMIVGAPTMAIATLRLPRRATLVLALVVFAAGHVVAAVSSSFAVVFGARVVTALVMGAFWSVAAAISTDAAGPGAASKALGVMMSGVGLATVVGVPLGSWAGDRIGWRAAFWALAGLTLIVAAVVHRLVPDDGERAIPSVRGGLAALRSPQLWLSLAGTVFVTGSYMATFSYISPLLTEHTGLSQGIVPLVLVGFGVGALVGTNVSGRLADRRPLATFVAASLGVAAVLVLLVAFSGRAATAVPLVVLLGVFGMAVPPVATGLAPVEPRFPLRGSSIAVTVTRSRRHLRRSSTRTGSRSRCPRRASRSRRPGRW